MIKETKVVITDSRGNELPIAPRRSFDAAKGSRHTADWLTREGTADLSIKTDLKSLRDRARDAERNDGYTEGILNEIVSNTIGPNGIGFKSMARKLDGRNKGGLANTTDNNACEKIAQAWEDFSKKGNFDVTRRLSRAQYERLALRGVARDGAHLTRLVDGFPKNRFRFAVQAIEADALDPRTNDDSKRIHMGIEYDEWDGEVAFHLTKMDNKAQSWKKAETFRVDADDMLNLFLVKRVTQSQGFSWLAPVLLRLRHLSEYEKSEVIAAREGANKIGFFEQTGEQQYTGDEDLSGNIVAPSAPGEWESLPYGVKANLIDPSHPNSNYPDFRKAILRGVCAGVMMNYNTIARDLEGVSFSSIRQGVLSERDSYKILHAWFIDDHVAPVFNRWLRMALMSGELEGLTMRDYDRLCHAEFSGRTWDWVDPVKDIEAIEREIELGMNSLSAAAKAKGRDFNKIVAQKKEDIKTLEAAGLNTTIGKKETEMKKVEPVQGESTPPK